FNATAIGWAAQVSASDALVLGNSSVRVGIGVSNPTSKLDIAAQDGLRITGFQPFLTLRDSHAGNARSVIQGFNASTNSFPQTFNGGNAGMVRQSGSGRVGIGTTSPDMTLSVNGNADKPGGGSWLNFSDERLKDIAGRFTPGLEAIMKLQPIRYQYK